MFTFALMKSFYVFAAALLLLPAFVKAQGSLKDSSISMTMVMPGYAMQIPAGDLKNRFGVNSCLSMDVIYKNHRRWFLDVQGSFIFGGKVKQPNLFSNLITSQGEIVGTDGKYADVRAFERGYYITLGGGKMFTGKKPNPNSGFFVAAGTGFIHHKIHIDDKNGVVPALQDDYLKGYDRLTTGFCLRQAAGYIYISNHRLVNFFAAVEGIEAFTKGRRSFLYDEERPDNSVRTDILVGLRVGWILPIYKAAPEKYYLY